MHFMLLPSRSNKFSSVSCPPPVPQLVGPPKISIRQEYTRPKGIRTAGHLGFSGSLALPLTNLATPLQNMERRLAVERSAAHDGGADVVALQAVKAIGAIGVWVFNFLEYLIFRTQMVSVLVWNR